MSGQASLCSMSDLRSVRVPKAGNRAFFQAQFLSDIGLHRKAVDEIHRQCLFGLTKGPPFAGA